MFSNHRAMLLTAALMLSTFLASFAVIPRADASQPYGGCDEAWQAPHSVGAKWCRSHGWIVRPRIVVGPHGHVRFRTMPKCITEDGSYLRRNGTVGYQRHCFWNARTMGNGRGSSYILDRVHPSHMTITFLHRRARP